MTVKIKYILLSFLNVFLILILHKNLHFFSQKEKERRRKKERKKERKKVLLQPKNNKQEQQAEKQRKAIKDIRRWALYNIWVNISWAER